MPKDEVDAARTGHDATQIDVGTSAPGVEAPAGSGALRPGQMVAGRVEVQGLLVQGWMGVVYRVHQKSVDRPAALKVLHSRYARDADLVKRFEREARAASRILHPNGVVIYDFGRDA